MQAGEVHVWIASLELDDADLARLDADLSAEEQARAAQLRFEQDRRRFVGAHSFLRRVLAQSLGCAPRAVTIAPGAGGKPELVPTGSGERPALRFNLAHSHDLVLCALALDREVGVDVERVRPLSDLDRLVSGVLSEREQAALRAWNGEAAAEAFLTAWTRKEAVLKARGDGLGREPASVEVSLGPREPVRVLGIDGEPGAERRWTLQAVDAAPGYVAAVAAEGEGWVVCRRFCAAGIDRSSLAPVPEFSLDS